MAPSFEAHGRTVQETQRPLVLDLWPVRLPDLAVRLQQPSSVQTGSSRSDLAARAQDRFSTSTVVQQRAIQIKEKRLEPFHAATLSVIKFMGHCESMGWASCRGVRAAGWHVPRSTR